MYTIVKDGNQTHVRAILSDAAEFEELIAKLKATMEQTSGQREPATPEQLPTGGLPSVTPSATLSGIAAAGYATGFGGTQEARPVALVNLGTGAARELGVEDNYFTTSRAQEARPVPAQDQGER